MRRFQIFHSTKFTNGAQLPCDFPLAVVFVTSTFGRFVKLYNLALISKYTTVPNLIKQLFHLRLLDMRLVIANSYPTRAHGIIVNYCISLS